MCGVDFILNVVLDEHKHIVKAVAGENVPEVITPTQSVDSLRLVLAEKQSATSGQLVQL